MNGIIIIDKPAGWTSHDVVAKLRGILKVKRVGHGGTLDPMASGVLPVFFGRATRAVQFCESFDKEYIAGLRLGVVTDTQDITGTVLHTSDVTASMADVKQAALRFIGVQEQLPPMYSAVKIGGRKLYELARRGIEAERKPRQITIETLEVLEQKEQDFLLRIACSKGTYVRTLCHDIGGFLGCGGTMSSLRRTRAGVFAEAEAIPISDVEAAAAAGRIGELARPVDSLFCDCPPVYIDERQKARCLNGADFDVDFDDGLYRVYDGNHSFLMLGQAGGGRMRTVKSFFDV
ncbi:MAG: tRNA pseudouridine(55) synthase TruB [Clostridiales bacterium]|nr:tRNA pseudouridine(55) synthase TruB [Clostridiales bacterium]